MCASVRKAKGKKEHLSVTYKVPANAIGRDNSSSSDFELRRSSMQISIACESLPLGYCIVAVVSSNFHKLKSISGDKRTLGYFHCTVTSKFH